MMGAIQDRQASERLWSVRGWLPQPNVLDANDNAPVMEEMALAA